MIKSLMAREVFKQCPPVKQLWGGEFWTDGYFASRVGKHGDEGMITQYVKEQGKVYLKLHRDEQLALFMILIPRPLAAGQFIFRR
jgi:putative transposase